MGLWSTKTIATLQAEPRGAHAAPAFERTLGALDLSALGIGAIIGAGIFVLTGTASAQYAGPAVVLSFIAAGLGCLFVGLCYAELASMIPVAGSAYTYSMAAFGELIAWIVGWDLILEYLFGAAAVAVSWSGYLSAFLNGHGVNLPAAFTQTPFVAEWGWRFHRVPDAIVNLPAMLLVGVATLLLVLGTRQAAIANRLIVFLKVAIVLIVIGFGFLYVNSANWHPFVPENGGSFGRYGWSGVLRGAAVVFFAFIGFDAVSTVAQEARSPQRDVPIGILASLLVCTALYVLMALVMTGLTHYPDLNVPHPLMAAVSAAGPTLHWLTYLIDLAILAGLASVVLVLLMGHPRILFAMARDGLLPRSLGRIHPRLKTPAVPTIVSGIVAAAIAGFFPIGALLELVSIGTLLVFVMVCGAVLVLRFRQPNIRRPFRAPAGPLVPILGIIFSVGTMLSVPRDSWIRLVIWNVIGIAIYFLSGAVKSRGRA